MLRDLRCSYVDAEKLRFDFNAPKALAAEQLVAVEALVNRWIGEAHPVQVATALALTHTRQEKSLGRTARRVSDKGRERSTPRTPTEAASHTTSLVESSPAEMSHSLSLSLTFSLTVQVAEMELAEAKAAGATAMFGEKYSDSVRVVDVPMVSMELCGGTHATNTAEIRGFKVINPLRG